MDWVQKSIARVGQRHHQQRYGSDKAFQQHINALRFEGQLNDLLGAVDTPAIGSMGEGQPVNRHYVNQSYIECGMIDLATFTAREEGK